MTLDGRMVEYVIKRTGLNQLVAEQTNLVNGVKAELVFDFYKRRMVENSSVNGVSARLVYRRRNRRRRPRRPRRFPKI